MSTPTTLRTRLTVVAAVLSILATVIVASPASANDYPCVTNNNEVHCGVDVDELLKDLARDFCDGGGGHLVTIHDGPDEYRHVDVCRTGGSGSAADPQTALNAPSLVGVATHGPANSAMADPSDVEPSELPVQAAPTDPGATQGEQPVPNDDGDPAPEGVEPTLKTDWVEAAPIRTTAKDQFQHGRIHVNAGTAADRGSGQAPLVLAIGSLEGSKPTKPFGVLILGGPGPAIGAVSPVNVGGVAASHYLGFDDSAQPAPTGETELGSDSPTQALIGWYRECKGSYEDCAKKLVSSLMNPNLWCWLDYSFGQGRGFIWCIDPSGPTGGLPGGGLPSPDPDWLPF